MFVLLPKKVPSSPLPTPSGGVIFAAQAPQAGPFSRSQVVLHVDCQCKGQNSVHIANFSALAHPKTCKKRDRVVQNRYPTKISSHWRSSPFLVPFGSPSGSQNDQNPWIGTRNASLEALWSPNLFQMLAFDVQNLHVGSPRRPKSSPKSIFWAIWRPLDASLALIRPRWVKIRIYKVRIDQFRHFSHVL